MPNFPARKANAITGSQFIQKISNFKSGSPARNKLIMDEVFSGNIPSFLRVFSPINVREGENSITYFVSPDYLSIGSDQDYVRVSTDAPTSQKIADQFNCILPTKKMVDQIYQQAKTKAAPAPMSGGSTVSGKFYSGKDFIAQKMQHADSLEEHNRMIERQLKRLDHKPGDLIAGIKKDVVIGNRLLSKPEAVNIYGWHDKSGKPIQPESTFHEAAYYDYSHSIRLVDRNCIVNGKSMDLTKVLKDPKLSHLVSYDGPLKATSYNDLKKKQEDEVVSKEQKETKSYSPDTNYTRITGAVTPKVQQRAKELLSKQMGDKIYENIDGINYMFVLEQHYHPPGFKGGPVGFHKGVSVFKEKTDKQKQEVQIPVEQKKYETKPSVERRMSLIDKLDAFLKNII
ncbi:MAG: hypothetical protein LC122_13515 [Chitinophagales bacterium]|nr:hypothetical protein [Chitinophagales bacterium]